MVPCVFSAVKSGAVSLMRSTAGSSAIAVLMFSPPEFNNSACSKAPDLTCLGSRPSSERTKPDKRLASVPGPRSWDILPRDLGSFRRPREMSIFARNHHPTGAAGKMQKRDCLRLLLLGASVLEVNNVCCVYHGLLGSNPLSCASGQNYVVLAHAPAEWW